MNAGAGALKRTLTPALRSMYPRLRLLDICRDVGFCSVASSLFVFCIVFPFINKNFKGDCDFQLYHSTVILATILPL